MVALLLLGACVPRAHLTMIDAADIELPDELRTIGVIDRSSAAGDDAAAARAAIDGLIAFVGSSRELHAQPGACAEGVQGVVVLEALSSDHRSELSSGVRIEIDELGQQEAVPTFTARLESQVRTTWSLSTCDDQPLDRLDDVRTIDVWTTKADERASAEQELPTRARATEELGLSAGIAYGRRICGTVDDAVRPYFVWGDPQFGPAGLAVRAGHWTDAMGAWRDVSAKASRDGVRAKALHNLAVAYEVLGNYDLALCYSEEAAATHDNGRIRRYRDLLRKVQAERRVLRRGEAKR